MTADSMHASHREHQAGRSAPYGAFGRELPRRKARAPNSAAAYLAALYSEKIRSGTLPSASVGNAGNLTTGDVTGLSARFPELLSRKFLASSHEPGK